MPGGNGIQALTAVKQGAAPPVVIMLTAFAYPQYQIRCLAAGADYFFDKTTEFDERVHSAGAIAAAHKPAQGWRIDGVKLPPNGRA